MKKKLIISIIISILYIGLVTFEPIWERTPGGFWNMLFYLVIGVLFFWLIIKIIIEIIGLIKQRNKLTLKLFIPIVILSFSFYFSTFNPLKIDLEKIYGKVIWRACYEGTQNQANFNLRDNGEFDIHWTGVFFHDHFFTGDYKKTGDTIFMNFKTEIPRF
ncbi:MAG: hypothetical protein HC905_29595 [Bacteroidales bacterium]|nr:hypothetical protein [Bacteroidales bacterium]